MANWRLWRARVREETRAALDTFRRSPAKSQTSPTAHLLAISDLHLGHDLKRGVKHDPSDLPALDRHLGDFLDHYREHREDGLPWRLVIVGDMVDFIAITETPNDDELVSFQVTDEERLYGLRVEPAKAVWKLSRVVRRHSHFCNRLAAFIARGHEVVIVRGNHDPEWTWPDVQETFRNAIVHYGSMLAPHESLRRIVGERISFRDWFYLEPGRFYAEHGHFYDEFSVTDELTWPTDGSAPEIREPVSTLAQRYFANKHTSLDLNNVERWEFLDFVRWGLEGGRFVRALADYFVMCGRVLAFSARASFATTTQSIRGLASSSTKRAPIDVRLHRIRASLQAVREDYEDLAKAILALTRPPAEKSVLATAQMLYFDRVLLGALTGVAVVGASVGLSTQLARVSALAGVLVGAAAANYWLGRSRVVDSHPKLIAAAHRVAALFRVPVVVMGHSHRVVDQPVGDTSRYYNLGTWLSPSRDDQQGPAGFPHVVVGSSGAVMRRWRLRSESLPEVVA
jgi:UDP-2,3-diacylglucosamine pyrophosphatase LpxH